MTDLIGSDLIAVVAMLVILDFICLMAIRRSSLARRQRYFHLRRVFLITFSQVLLCALIGLYRLSCHRNLFGEIFFVWVMWFAYLSYGWVLLDYWHIWTAWLWGLVRVKLRLEAFSDRNQRELRIMMIFGTLPAPLLVTAALLVYG